MKDIKVNYFHFCDAANIDSNGKVSILGIFDRMFFQTLPSKYPKFTVVFNVGFQELSQVKNELEIKIFDSQEKEIILKTPIKITFQIENTKLKKEGNFNVILDILNIELKSFGTHKAVVYFNQKEIANKKLLVETKK